MECVALVAAERERQVAAEGYSQDRDVRLYPGGETLAIAAACYAMPPARRQMGDESPAPWPWLERYWKPTPSDRERELVKAAALILAALAVIRAERG